MLSVRVLVDAGEIDWAIDVGIEEAKWFSDLYTKNYRTAHPFSNDLAFFVIRAHPGPRTQIRSQLCRLHTKRAYSGPVRESPNSSGPRSMRGPHALMINRH